MKAREWHRYLEEQDREHGKRLFTVTELANAGRSSRRAIGVELHRLLKGGLLARYARGLYGLPGIVAPDILLPELDSHAYITGSYALFRHNLIAQLPVLITGFTDRRHGQARERTTPVGTFRFVCVRAPIYSPPAEGVIASAEQAFCDFIYLSRRSGTDPAALASFRNLNRLQISQMLPLLSRYPRGVVAQARNIMDQKNSLLPAGNGEC